MRHAFIADGRLFFRDEDGRVREIESRFAREKAEKAGRRDERQGWKGQVDESNPLFNRGVVWGGQAAQRAFVPFRFMNVVMKDPDTFYYVISNGEVVGLFGYIVSEDRETRLFTDNHRHVTGIDYSTATDELIISVLRERLSADLELLDLEGHSKRALTSGDSRDGHPWFSRSLPGHVLYQSAGIARDEHGELLALAPEEILRTNIETGELKKILADERYDFLLPKDDRDGNLYCIRRPHRAPGERTAMESLGDLLLFPFRFAVAVYNFLYAFTRLFNTQAPKLAGPQVRPPVEGKVVRVLGETIDLAKIQKEAKNEEEFSLVPGTWELLKVAADGPQAGGAGRQTVLASKVSWFDVTPEGAVHFTNGYRVSEFGDRAAETLFKHRMIESLRLVATPGPPR